jgi:uncharacterized protein with von Willebrand factor type A (vWA) domain
MSLTEPARLSAGLAVAFVDALRSAGLIVPTSSTIGYVDALSALGIENESGVYWSGRACLITRPEDIETYDDVFQRFWFAAGAGELSSSLTEEFMLAMDTDDSSEDDSGEDGDADLNAPPPLELRFSSAEILRGKDFADWTEEELAQSQRLMRQLRFVGSPRRSLRMTASNKPGTRLDLRRTVRSALAADGEPIRRHFRRRSSRPRRLVLLLDVSGSMEPYARALIRFAHAAVAGRQRVEVFALGTRLTRITRELARRDVDEAITRAAVAVTDWSGGTRLGEGLRRFNRDWGQRGMARGAIVVILSDGWDRGDPDALSEQMERLRRFTHRLVWVNPLKVTPGYAPLARGMAAALPHVDEFVEGHSLHALEELAAIIGDAQNRRIGHTVRTPQAQEGATL